MAQNRIWDDRSRNRGQGGDRDQGEGWQGSSGNWEQDRQRGQQGRGSAGQEHHGQGWYREGREHAGSSPYDGPGAGEGGGWNRMGRYGDEGWHGERGGGQGWDQDHNYGMDRDFDRSDWRGQSRWFDRRGGRGRGEAWGSWMEGPGAYGRSGYGGSGYGGSGYGGSGYGGMSRGGHRSGEGERDFWDRASDEVSSWFGDEDAQRRRERDQHRGRGPKGYTRSDDRIREDVNDRLTDDNWLDASDIEVQVSNAEVTLSGEIGSRDDKRRAEDIAESVSGVSHVQNNLRVRSSTERGAGSRVGSTDGTSGASSTTTTGAIATSPGSSSRNQTSKT